MTLRRSLCVASVLLAGLAPASRGQNFSGLEGQELHLSGDLESGLTSLLTGVLSGSQGRLERVVVTDDRERRLVVRVGYRDLAGRRLVGELQAEDGRGQPELNRASVDLEAATGDAELVFGPRTDRPASQPAESKFLLLKVLRPSTPVPEQQLTFRLGKRWHLGGGADASSPGGEPEVVRVVAQPEGKAAELRENGRLVLPPVRIPVATSAPTAHLAPVQSGHTPYRTYSLHAVRPQAGTQAHAMPQSSAHVKAVTAKTATAVQQLPTKSAMFKAELFHYGVGKDITSRQGKGPGAAAFDLLEGLRAEPGLPIEAITRLSRRVFQDQNPASGIFYFLPEAYYVSWDPDSGYGLRMLYSAATAPGEAGEVMMAAQLDSGVDSSEIQLARALLHAYHARHPQVAFTEVRQLPIDAAPEVSLAGDLQHQYEVAADRTSVGAFSDVLSEIQVSWVTDTVTKENMQLALVEDVGINGVALLTPAGGGMPPQQVPVRIELADVGTLGPIFWHRDVPWHNEMPYPVRLRYLHALLIDRNVPVVYTWNLDQAMVPPRARLDFDASRVPRWLDQRALRMWIDYVPIASCNACDEAVVASITGGVTSLGASRITFHTISPLADTGAYEISVNVRSRYFDPKSRDSESKPGLVLDADDQDFTIGPIYLVNRQPGERVPGDPLFEYSLTVAMPDGATYKGVDWIPSDDLRVLVGRVQVERALGGALPGAAATTPPQ